MGDSILINYNNRRYFIDIIEARPNDAVSIVDTDCEVDFAPPLDYVEPSPVKPPVVKPESAEGGASGSGADKGKEAEAEVVDVGGPKFPPSQAAAIDWTAKTRSRISSPWRSTFRRRR